MQIIKERWQKQKEELHQAIAEAEIIAFDFEFTGFSDMQEAKMTWQDSVETRYAKGRYTACHFIPIQIGVSCFKWRDKAYESKTFNIYLTPHSSKRSFTFLTQVRWLQFLTSALVFLRQNKFDFNKWLDHAISYWRLSDVEKLNQQEPSQFFYAPLSCQSEKETAKLVEQVMEWQKQTNPKPLEIEVPNYAIRFALYKQDYIMEGRGDPKVVIKVNRKELQKQQNQIKKQKVEADSQPSSQPSPSLPSPPPPSASQPEIVQPIDPPSSQESSQKSEEEEKKGIPAQSQKQEVKEQGIKRMKEEQEINTDWQNVIGFSRVVEWMTKRDVPIIVHNGFYDLCLLYQHFINELPEDYSTFSAHLRQLFKGGIYDTKYMQQNFYWIYANNLQSLYLSLEKNQITKNQLSIKHAQNYTRYENLNQAHEAGYDAFMTGCAFIRMAKSDEINVKFHQEKTKASSVEQVEKQFDTMKLKDQSIHEASKAMENTPLNLEKTAQFRNKLSLNPALKTFYSLDDIPSQPGDPHNESLLEIEVLPETSPAIFRDMLRELADYTVKRTGKCRLQIEFYHTHKPMEFVIEKIKEIEGVVKAQPYADAKKFTFLRKIS